MENYSNLRAGDGVGLVALRYFLCSASREQVYAFSRTGNINAYSLCYDAHFDGALVIIVRG